MPWDDLLVVVWSWNCKWVANFEKLRRHKNMNSYILNQIIFQANSTRVYRRIYFHADINACLLGKRAFCNRWRVSERSDSLKCLLLYMMSSLFLFIVCFMYGRGKSPLRSILSPHTFERWEIGQFLTETQLNPVATVKRDVPGENFCLVRCDRTLCSCYVSLQCCLRGGKT